MNMQEVPDSHLESHIDPQKYCTQGQQLCSDTHRQTDRHEQAHGVTATHTDPMGMGLGTPRDRHSHPASHHNRGQRVETEDRK